MGIMTIWRKITNNGIDDKLDGKETIKVRLLNQLIFISFSATSLLIIAYLLYDNSNDRVWNQLISITIESSIFLSITFKKYDLAKFLGCFFYATVLAIEVVQYGGNVGEVNFFTLLGFTALVMYENKRLLQILSVLYICLLYIGGQLYIIHYNIHSTSYDNPYDELVTFPLMIIGIGFLLMHYLNELKKYENEKQQLIHNLQQANYELRTFNYIASHDIKEPIRNIGSYVGLIRRKLPDNLKESLGFYFDTIKRSTTQLYTLIEDFAKYTTLSKDEKISLETVDLNLLTKNVTETLELIIEKYNGQVVFNNLPQIQSSSSLLFTALKNLIENGLKYNKSETPMVNIDYQETETHHQIIVSDNGIGIPEEYHDKIFEMFKRLHNRGEYEGSGIGLAIVKLCVDKLDGKLKLKSEIEKGSQFIVQLPK